MIEGRDYASIDGNIVDPEASGASFAIIRAAYTYKGSDVHDLTAKNDRPRWRKLGKTVGAYMILGWAKTGSSPEKQVANFIASYDDRQPGELPPSLDLEADSANAIGMTHAEALAWAERAYDALVKHYGIVLIYTSARVYTDVFGDLPSKMGASPLWIKIPYPWRAKQPPHPESCPTAAWVFDHLPPPWRDTMSPGAWIVQYQGDAIHVDGFTGTVDLNAWLPWYGSQQIGYRTKAVYAQLAVKGFKTLIEFQHAEKLLEDDVLGPKTFSLLFA